MSTPESSAKHVLMVAGDPSADRHAAALVDALRTQAPGLRVSALGGDHLQGRVDRFLYPLVGLGGFGFLEPLMKLPQLWKALRRVTQCLDQDRPDVVIPVDYYGFNIHVARRAHARNIPVIYYISPQVWASRPHRIRRLATCVTRMLVLFPFEVELYRRAGIPVTLVGHPLLDRLPEPAGPPAKTHIGLMPGSRPTVISRHLPILAHMAHELHQKYPDARFTLFRPVETEPSLYSKILSNAPWIELATDPDYSRHRSLSIAVSVSGTAALENTLLGIPMVIMYRLSPLTYAIAKRVIRIPFVGIPNILAGRAIVPELLQDAATPERLSQTVLSLLSNPESLRKMREELLALRRSFPAGGTQAAAKEILEELRNSESGMRNEAPLPIHEAV